ncbi:MAG: T9SS type A sorting domain-containing protein [Bacteroidales bacterium]|nr:T9SS type A sorting domain-containing protein [Bacteroidales bacterium]
MKKKLLLCIFGIITVFLLNSQNSFYDYSFAGTGFVVKSLGEIESNFILCVEEQNDGKILVAGIKKSNENAFVGRYNVDGSIDNTFGIDGFVVIENIGSYAQSNMDLKICNDEKIIFTTSRTIEPDDDIVLIKLNSDGSYDETFGSNGMVDIDLGGDEYINNIIINGDGSFYVSGYQWIVMENESEFLLAKFTEDGIMDENFGNDGYILTEFDPALQLWDHSMAGIQLQNGNIMLVGTSYNSSSNYASLACYNPDGSLQSSFSDDGLMQFELGNSATSNFSESIIDIQETNDNKILVLGNTEIDGTSFLYIRSLNLDGSVNESFGDNGVKFISHTLNPSQYGKCSITSDNKIVVYYMYFDDLNFNYNIIRLNSDGSTDLEFGNQGLISVDGVLARSFCLTGNRLLCVGSVNIENFSSIYIARHIGKNIANGIIYFDENQDNEFTEGELRIAQNIVLVEPGSSLLISNNEGVYEFYGNPGNYTFEYMPSTNWEQTSSPTNFEIDITDDSEYFTGLDFGISPISEISDVASNIVGTATRAGFETSTWLNYSNEGTITSQGTISFAYDPLLTLIETDPVFESHNNNQILWEYDALSPFENRTIYMRFQVPSVDYLDDTLVSSCSITPIISDVVFNNNLDTINQIITASYDPNDKSVTPRGIGEEGFVLHNTELNYTIRFQNTGTDTAFNIVIIDTLDTNLKIETFKFNGASHPCNIKINTTSDGRKVISFAFNNILLPHDNINESASNGFLKYAISPKESLPDNTQILNTAFIYFDFNPPITTNTVVNTFISNLTDIDKLSKNLTVFPNPTNGKIYIKGDNVTSISVHNLDGRVIKSTQSIEEVDLTNLKNGIYFVTIFTKDNKSTVKVIKTN